MQTEGFEPSAREAYRLAERRELLCVNSRVPYIIGYNSYDDPFFVLRLDNSKGGWQWILDEDALNDTYILDNGIAVEKTKFNQIIGDFKKEFGGAQLTPHM